MGFGKLIEEVDGGIASIRSTINDQLWLADIEQAAICLLHEDLLEDVKITRGVPDIDTTATPPTAQGKLPSVDCAETKATQEGKGTKLYGIENRAPGPDTTVKFPDSSEFGFYRHSQRFPTGTRAASWSLE